MKKLFVLIISGLLLVIGSYTMYGLFKPLPGGLALDGPVHEVSEAKFIYDLTYEKDGEVVKEQAILDYIVKMVEDAEQFIVIDMFLFNDKHDEGNSFPEVTERLTEAIVNKREENNNIAIAFITDPVNTGYGSYQSPYLKKLRKHGVDVLVTNLTPIRDANPIYSGFWRGFLKSFGESTEIELPNPFSEQEPKLTLNSYFKLLNLRGNHRKVLTTEKEALVTSANIHDASAFHSNIAFVVSGDVIHDILEGERAVESMSGVNIVPSSYRLAIKSKGDIKVQYVTEGKIKEQLMRAITDTGPTDEINVGMFFLSESEVVSEMLRASERGVRVKIILDPSETIFGHDNIGVPNKTVAQELLDYGNENFLIKFYNTNDEQYHTKLAYIKREDVSTIIGGSANFTRRSLDNYNLEANFVFDAPTTNEFVKDVDGYFTRLWNNTNGQYTVEAKSKLIDFPTYKRYLFRLQKKTGLTTF